MIQKTCYGVVNRICNKTQNLDDMFDFQTPSSHVLPRCSQLSNELPKLSWVMPGGRSEDVIGTICFFQCVTCRSSEICIEKNVKDKLYSFVLDQACLTTAEWLQPINMSYHDWMFATFELLARIYSPNKFIFFLNFNSLDIQISVYIFFLNHLFRHKDANT